MPTNVPQILAEGMRPFARCFTAAVWRHVLVLVTGTLLVPGRRTVTAALRVMGLGQSASFALYHRVLSLARWSSRAVSHRLLLLLVAAFVPQGPVVIAISEGWSFEHNRRHKRLTEWARQVLVQTARWLPGRQVIAVADRSFSAIALLRDVGRFVCLISRLRLDAGLYEPPPRREPGRRGRPRVKGARLPSLAERLTDPSTSWTRITLEGWYGRRARRLDIAFGTALWHHPGMQVPIRWVLVRDVAGEKAPQAFVCTDLA